jgi:outer membrane protein TolC
MSSNKDLKASRTELERLHAEVAKALTKELKNAPTAAVITAAIAFLKNNGVSQPPIPGDADDPLNEVASSLPFPASQDLD